MATNGKLKLPVHLIHSDHGLPGISDTEDRFLALFAADREVACIQVIGILNNAHKLMQEGDVGQTVKEEDHVEV